MGGDSRRAGGRMPQGGLCAILLGLLLLPGPASAHVALDEQIADLTAQIERRSEVASLYLKRGDLYRYRGEWRNARADYRRARRIDPALKGLDLSRGTLLLEEGKPGRAVAVLDRYLERRPGDPVGLRMRARARRALGMPLEAAEDLRQAIAAIDPPRREPDDFLDRARALAAAGPDHLDEAIRALDEGMAALGPIVSLQIPAIDFCLQAGHFEEALQRVDVLAAGAGRREAWLAKRGEILERAGREAEARDAYAAALRALEMLPPDARRNRVIGKLEGNLRAALSRLTSHPGEAPGGW